jgi:lipoate-protein ligase A
MTTAGGAPFGEEWRLLCHPPAPGAWNMGVDEALADSVRAGGPPVLRFYRWDPPCLSLGRNQPARGQYDPGRMRAHGIQCVRRPTGGRAVLHDRELTYSVALPEDALGGPRAAYAAMNRALVAGLRRLQVPADVQGETGRRAPAPSLAPCFAEPVAGEVAARGRKLVGSAQRRERGVLLQHGSLPLAPPRFAVSSLLRGRDGDGGETPPACFADFAPVPEWERLVATLAAGCAETLGVELVRDCLTEDEECRAEAAAGRHRDPTWLWRL